jgi:hypothetical protein
MLSSILGRLKFSIDKARDVRVLLLTLSLALVWLDWQVAGAARKQWASAHFLSTTGLIRECRLDSGGRYPRLALRYQYKVGSHQLESQRFCYSLIKQSKISWAAEFVAQHPIGSKATVYYNPIEPAESLLLPGPLPEELALWLYLCPFHSLLLGAWAYFVLKRPRLASAAAQATGLSMLAIFLVSLLPQPTWPSMTAIWVGYLCASFFLLWGGARETS